MVRLAVTCIALVCYAGVAVAMAADADRPVVVGSKKFTESVILGEIAKGLAEDAGTSAVHQSELGGTAILFNALKLGEIDIYPEYSGTIMQEILVKLELTSEQEMRDALAEFGIHATKPLGFNNTYAMGMKHDAATRLNVETISNLRQHPNLRLGFTSEFMDRGDGWPALRKRYGLPQKDVRGLDHDLALRALNEGDIDLTDLYSTDAEIAYYGFKVLEDDLSFFPRYEALFLYRTDLETRAPEVVKSLHRIAGTIDEIRMIQMNRQAKIDHETEAVVAAEYLRQQFDVSVEIEQETWVEFHYRHLRQHLTLVISSMLPAIVVAIPAGILAAKVARVGQVILAGVGIIQTIPAIALLVLLLHPFGIGAKPAIVALFLYALLPIVRNTHAGFGQIDLSLRESAEALGMSTWFKLWKMELPLASRTILAGIKTAAVINVGFATLGGFIGAGGYGQPIFTGLRRDDMGLIMHAAVAVALLALLVQAIFEWAERAAVPKGLRLRRAE